MNKIDLRLARKITNSFTSKVSSIKYTPIEDVFSDEGCKMGITSMRGDDRGHVRDAVYCIYYVQSLSEDHNNYIMQNLESSWEKRADEFGTKRLIINNFLDAQLYILLHEIGHVMHYCGMSDEESADYFHVIDNKRSRAYYLSQVNCETMADNFAYENFYKVKQFFFKEECESDNVYCGGQATS